MPFSDFRLTGRSHTLRRKPPSEEEDLRSPTNTPDLKAGTTVGKVLALVEEPTATIYQAPQRKNNTVNLNKFRWPQMLLKQPRTQTDQSKTQDKRDRNRHAAYLKKQFARPDQGEAVNKGWQGREGSASRVPYQERSLRLAQAEATQIRAHRTNRTLSHGAPKLSGEQSTGLEQRLTVHRDARLGQPRVPQLLRTETISIQEKM